MGMTKEERERERERKVLRARELCEDGERERRESVEAGVLREE